MVKPLSCLLNSLLSVLGWSIWLRKLNYTPLNLIPS